jgi:glycosyltransferase involved in cell wall biosynthesis
MRVLPIIPRLVVGGAERMVARLAGHLTRWGHTVMVVAMFDPLETWIEAELRAEQVPVRFLGKKPGLDGRMVPRIARVISEFEPDVIHTHLGVLKYVVPAMLLSRRRPVVHTLHTLADKEADRATRL